jgi:hypothetical protein
LYCVCVACLNGPVASLALFTLLVSLARLYLLVSFVTGPESQIALLVASLLPRASELALQLASHWSQPASLASLGDAGMLTSRVSLASLASLPLLAASLTCVFCDDIASLLSLASRIASRIALQHI